MLASIGVGVSHLQAGGAGSEMLLRESCIQNCWISLTNNRSIYLALKKKKKRSPNSVCWPKKKKIPLETPNCTCWDASVSEVRWWRGSAPRFRCACSAAQPCPYLKATYAREGTSSNFCGFELGWDHCSAQEKPAGCTPSLVCRRWRLLSSSLVVHSSRGRTRAATGRSSVQESLPNRCTHCKLKTRNLLCNSGRHILFKDRNVDPFTK